MEWPVNLTVIWHLLLNSCKLIHIHISTHKNCRNYANSIRWHGKKFSESGIFNSCIPAVTAYLQFMCTSVCDICWNTVLGMIGTHCAEVQHVLLPCLGLPILTHCRAVWTFVFILVAEWKFSFSLSWLKNDGHPHLSALGFVQLLH